MNKKTCITESKSSEIDYKKEFMRLLESHAASHSASELFLDFLAIATLSAEIAVIKTDTYSANVSFETACKEKYSEIEIIKDRHSSNDYDIVNLTVDLLNIIAEQLTLRPYDFLGDIYMELSISNSQFGQFFTPPSIAELIAKTVITKAAYDTAVAEKGFLSIEEPACGAGGMIIEAYKILREVVGTDVHHNLFVNATDISRVCAQMTYIQLTTLGITAVVTRGNSLDLNDETRTSRLTLGFHLYGWIVKTRIYPYIPSECLPILVKIHKDEIDKRNTLQNLVTNENNTEAEGINVSQVKDSAKTEAASTEKTASQQLELNV